MPSEAGDIVAFYFTTTHCGNTKRLRHLPNLNIVLDKHNRPLYSKLVKNIPSRFIAPIDKPRIVLFMTFGRKGEHLDHYLKYCRKRDFAIRFWSNLNYTKEVIQEIHDSNIAFRDMSNVPNEIDMSTVGKHRDSGY